MSARNLAIAAGATASIVLIDCCDLEDSLMRPFIAACVVIILIGVGAAVTLDRFVQEPVSVAFATSGARI
jgi:hypothetical protein